MLALDGSSLPLQASLKAPLALAACRDPRLGENGVFWAFEGAGGRAKLVWPSTSKSTIRLTGFRLQCRVGYPCVGTAGMVGAAGQLL